MSSRGFILSWYLLSLIGIIFFAMGTVSGTVSHPK